jgi:putative inorganic carbon (hco3(-)) transporter
MESQAAASQKPLQTTAFWVLTTAVASVTVSIAVSQILLAAALLLAVLSRRPVHVLRPERSLLISWLVFMAWTTAAALHAHDVARSLLEAKKFFLYTILFLTPLLLSENGMGLRRMYWMIFAFSAFSGCAGLVQFVLHPSLDLQHRISGFMSHWMTYSGLLMLVLVTLAAYAYCGRKVRLQWWVVPLALVLGAGMYLSQTRNAWLGSIAGLTVVFSLRRPRLVLCLAAMVVSLYFISPPPIQQRLRSGWDQNDPETRGRLELAGTAIRLIKDHPWMGVGPKNINRESLRYRGSSEFPDWMYQHMHNNALQIAGERGIPGLLLWLGLMGQMGWNAFSVYRSSRLNAGEACTAATAALGCLAALLVAGMFEYNFGDSEVVTMFLFLMAAPYAFRGSETETRR